jgi:hypothetical protein
MQNAKRVGSPRLGHSIVGIVPVLACMAMLLLPAFLLTQDARVQIPACAVAGVIARFGLRRILVASRSLPPPN